MCAEKYTFENAESVNFQKRALKIDNLDEVFNFSFHFKELKLAEKYENTMPYLQMTSLGSIF